MKDALQIIRTESMKQFFKDKPFITTEDYEANKGAIMILGGSLRKISKIITNMQK